MPREADFTSTTTNIIAARAGFRCSFPGCGLATIGPGGNSHRIAKTGTAAHIFSSAPDGPRRTGGLTIEERKNHQNGIWLCRNHGALIDTNGGIDYPAVLLQSWKALHEARIASEIRGHAFYRGWVHSMRILASPPLADNESIQLGKVTLLFGNKMTGKTAICEWLAGSTASRYFDRWVRRGGDYNGVSYVIEFSNPVDHKAIVHFDGVNVTYKVDEAPSAGLDTLVKIIYIHDKMIDFNSKNDKINLSNSLNINQK